MLDVHLLVGDTSYMGNLQLVWSKTNRNGDINIIFSVFM